MPDLQREIEHLAEADRHIAEGQVRVSEQQLRLGVLRQNGSETGLAERLLETLEGTLCEWRSLGRPRASVDFGRPSEPQSSRVWQLAQETWPFAEMRASQKRARPRRTRGASISSAGAQTYSANAPCASPRSPYTSSPGRNRSTPAPTDSTVPAKSVPLIRRRGPRGPITAGSMSRPR